MARIRTVKPEFFRHEGLFDAERESGLPLRVAFAGLWTACDKAGRFVWKPRSLKLDCLPHDDVDFSRVLDALASRGFVLKYTIEGVEYGCVPSWFDHQVPNNKERESEIQPPPESQDETIASTRGPRVDHASPAPLGKDRVEGEQGREGNGKEERAAVAPPPAGKGEEAKPAPHAKQSPSLDGSADLKDQLFGPCLEWLGERTKKPPDKYRSAVGRWIKDWGEAAVLDAFLRARRELPLEPVAWIEGALRAGDRKNGKSAGSVGPDWNRRVEDFKSLNFWVDSWGQKPGEKFCQAPASILHQHGYRGEAA